MNYGCVSVPLKPPKKLKPKPKQHADDYELWLRAGALGEVWNLTEPLVVYRKTPLVYYLNLNRRDKI